jgi:phosphatidylglycerol:prolipoprotein diacylglycerol transferase
VHKIALELGGLTVHWYGVLVACGFLLGLWTASRRGLRDGIDPADVVDIGTWLILGTIVGARALYVVSYWKEQFADQPFWEVAMVHHGGLVFYGGLLGATIAGWIFVRYRRLPFWRIADVLAPSIALGHALGRIGCLMNGCCFGAACSMPWAIHFPAEHETQGAGVHPTQVYEALLNALLYGFLAWHYRRRQFAGQIFSFYLIGYAALRLWVESYRGDYAVYYLRGRFTPAQVVSAGLLAVGLILWTVLGHGSRQTSSHPR